jgi:hypothetical protein
MSEFIIISHQIKVDMLVICIVDIEVFLAMIGEGGVELEEVLTPRRY